MEKTRSSKTRRPRPRANNDIPVVIFSNTVFDYEEELESRIKAPKSTGLVYDERMLLHRHEWDENYPECPARISSPWTRINSLGLAERCCRIEAIPIDLKSKSLNSLHDENYLKLIQSSCASGDRPSAEELMKNMDGIFVSQHTWDAALLSAGGVLELTKKVVEEKVANGMAVVRPPGHHAMQKEACGYCFVNNVGVAAEWATEEFGLKRVLIVDWDVHHGQGTQYQFYDRKDVLYFSIHRYERAAFWPNLRESDYDFIGGNAGKGYNVNVPLNETGMSNSDYLAIFNNILMPIAYEYCPQLVIVSAGYDAAVGCPEGEMEVTPACYAHLIHQLMAVSNGKVVVALEGGYCIESLSEGVALTLRTLLGDAPPRLVDDLKPLKDSMVETINNCTTALRDYWKSIRLQPISQTLARPDLSNLKTESWDDVKLVDFPEEYPALDPDKNEELQERIKNLVLHTELPNATEGRTCYVYDEEMMRHESPLSRISHPEIPDRIRYIDNALNECGLLENVTKLPSRMATIDEMNLAHEMDYLRKLQHIESKGRRNHVVMTQTATNSCYYSEHVFQNSALACGSLLNIVDAVCEGRYRNGFAAIRPPGHHAGIHQSEGFCYVNHIAVAARYAQKTHKASRVLIVDWDVHHGNGTQEIFESDPSVLFISLHRYDPKRFYPFSIDGAANKIGKGSGVGLNVNVAFRHHHTRDAAYIMAFLHLVMPIAMEFNPDLVLVSSGFDAADGDSMGGFKLSPLVFAHMTHHLCRLAGGRVILSLEGGYKDRCLASCSCQCVASLQGLPCPRLPSKMRPKEKDIEAIRKTALEHSNHWKSLRFTDPIPEWVSIRNTRQGSYSSVSSASGLIDEFGDMSLDDRTRGMRVEAKTEHGGSCTHTESRQPIPEAGLDTNAPCKVCGKATENWVCLTCYEASGSAATNDTVPNAGDLFGDEWADMAVVAVCPLLTCPHLSQVASLPEEGLNHQTPCEDCGHTKENWVCLVCYKVFCSRYVKGHMVTHGEEAKHPMVLSYVDLSAWCYECDSYIHNEILTPAKESARISKFGE